VNLNGSRENYIPDVLSGINGVFLRGVIDAHASKSKTSLISTEDDGEKLFLSFQLTISFTGRHL